MALQIWHIGVALLLIIGYHILRRKKEVEGSGFNKPTGNYSYG